MTTSREDKSGGLTLAELAEKTGCPQRTIRFYIARGLLPPPNKAGRGASYGEEHLRRIGEIRQLQSKGLTLAEISRKLTGETQTKGTIVPTMWWMYQLAPDVILQVRSDASPWRLRTIQRALGELMAALSETITDGGN